METNATIMKQEMTEQELQHAAGGDIIDDAVCFFKGHTWKELSSISYHNGDIQLNHSICTCCGKVRYLKYVKATDQLTETNAAEYNHYLNTFHD